MENLVERIKQLENRVEYEKSLRIKMTMGMKKAIHQKFSKDLKLELDGLQNLSEKMNDENGRVLKMYLMNIQQLLEIYNK